jgi:hypothetical protein
VIEAGTDRIIDVSEYASLRDFERRYVTEIIDLLAGRGSPQRHLAVPTELIIRSRLRTADEPGSKITPSDPSKKRR